MGLDSFYFLKATDWHNHQHHTFTADRNGSCHYMLHQKKACRLIKANVSFHNKAERLKTVADVSRDLYLHPQT